MTDIPEDIQDEALQIAHGLSEERLSLVDADDIGKALLAERERATKAERERSKEVVEGLVAALKEALDWAEGERSLASGGDLKTWIDRCEEIEAALKMAGGE